jgi:hypothetical protein
VCIGSHRFLFATLRQYLHHLLSFIFSVGYRRGQSINLRQKRSQCKLTLTLPEDFSEFTPEVRAAAIGALAGVLDIPRDQIRVLDVQPGSIILKLEIPSESLDKLIALYEDNDPAIRGLGIYSIIEELSEEEEYVLSNIRSMLIDMFSLEEIRTFCYEKFRNVYEHINSDSISKKEQIADMIVGYVHQESCIPVLLDYSHEFHRDIYYRHTPYHNVPRKPEEKKK